ncbi:HD domain-containing protein [Patescibacteria group bacterium]|jgi:dGTPase|nr:HD domain-containing protein [Patescibacteria group bacterium]
MLDPFADDLAKILCSKALRRAADKTQISTDPSARYIRTRGAHIDEVVAISAVTADLLGLNTSLAQAAAFGHDIGHVPLGHPGEEWVAKKMGLPFCHEVMGPIVAQRIERKGKGLNLTFQTLEGMMCHSGNTAREGMTPEAWVVRYCDKFAFIFADMNDLERMGLTLPNEVLRLASMFGSTQRERTTTAIAALMLESSEHGRVSFEHCELAQYFVSLRHEMYKVYRAVSQQNVGHILEPIVERLAALEMGDPFLLFALMTDKDINDLRSRLMIDVGDVLKTSAGEIIPHLKQIGPIDLCDSELDW